MSSIDRHHWRHPPAPVGTDHHGVGLLGPDQCLHLIAAQSIGRLGFSAQALPVIFPVNFVLVDDHIVFRTEAGQKLDAARQNAVACFEADDYDSMAHTGWSVLVTGRLTPIVGHEVDGLESAPLRPWAMSDASHTVALSIDVVSGRVIGPPTVPPPSP